MVPSESALASQLPSGLNATPYTPFRAPVWRVAPTGWLVSGFHNSTVPSESALASSLPSGLNATSYTPGWRPVAAGRGGPAGWAVTAFHTRTVPRLPAL